MIDTSLTRLLGIRLPILQGGMSWVSRHRLASAVSEAGGLGVLGAATMEPEELQLEIRAVREWTQKPFAVNVPLMCLRPDGTPIAEELVEVAIEERVPVVITGAGSPERFTAPLKNAGATVIHVVPSPGLAQKAERAGVDAVIAESCEAAGHVRKGGLATFSLVPQVVDAVTCPVVAAGGIADARGVLAALALGADAIQMGTRFVSTFECEAHSAFKAGLVDASPEESVVYGALHASRALATPIVRHMVELERRGATPEEIQVVRGRHRAQLGCIEGDLDEGLCPSGSAVGLVHEIVSVSELIDEIVGGVQAQLEELECIFDGEYCGR